MEMISSSEENPDRRPIRGRIMGAGPAAQIYLVAAIGLGAATRGNWILLVLLCAAALYAQRRDTFFHECEEAPACDRCGALRARLICERCHGSETNSDALDDG
jgi:hypothetical protein